MMALDLSMPTKPTGSRFAYLREFTVPAGSSHATANGQDAYEAPVSDDGFESTPSNNSAISSGHTASINFKPQHQPLPERLTINQDDRTSHPRSKTFKPQYRSLPERLTISQEDNITHQIMEVYNALRPREEFRIKRVRFLEKLQAILNRTWPEHRITACLFGSSVNGLGTETSDVDICLVTSWEDLDNGVLNVHLFADAMRSNKMERVYTISKAKVPICKFYDPVYNISCDVNINNKLALRNTEFIKAYVDLDERVRPLLLILKHWTKQRDLNDAVKGGTLSSYCWVQMFLNFLQTRNPPILPSLQKLYLDQLRNRLIGPSKIENGVDCSFYSDLESLKNFGKDNNESLGQLLYAFFRRFAVEYDYDNFVVSVRVGGYLSKEEKGWNVDVERTCRHLCVEEPFTITRNLANSADAPTVVGLRLEFELAAHILATSGEIASVMAKYIPPMVASESSPKLNVAEVYANGLGLSPNGGQKLLPTMVNENPNGSPSSHASKVNPLQGNYRGGYRNNSRPYSPNGHGNYSYPYPYVNGYSQSSVAWPTYIIPGVSPPPVNRTYDLHDSGHSHIPPSPGKQRGSLAEYRGSSPTRQQGRILKTREYPEYSERVFDEFGSRDHSLKDYNRSPTINTIHNQIMSKLSHDSPPRAVSGQRSYTSPPNNRSAINFNINNDRGSERPIYSRNNSRQENYQRQHERRNHSSSPASVKALDHRGTQTGSSGRPTRRRSSSDNSNIPLTSPTLSAGVSQVDGRSEFVRDRESAETQTPPSPVGTEKTSPMILPLPSNMLVSSTIASPQSLYAVPYLCLWGDIEPERTASMPLDMPGSLPSPEACASATSTLGMSSPPMLDESPYPSTDDGDSHVPKHQRKLNKSSRKGKLLWSNCTALHCVITKTNTKNAFI